MRVFECDHTLPSLPVPELCDTCENLKTLAKPLITKSEWDTLSDTLDTFLKEDGNTLQHHLLQWKANQTGNASWLRPIWDDNYLAFRDRLPINMNYTFQLIKERWGNLALPKLLYSFCCVLDQLRREELPIETIRDVPISMDTLAYTIYTRIPDAQRDFLQHLPLSTPYSAAVVCQGYWYQLSLTDHHGMLLSPDSLKQGLDAIRANPPKDKAPAPLGAITCAPRPEAALLREQLQEHRLNRINLQQIEDAVCVVCLDDNTDTAGVMHELIIGTPRNRWFDKSIQFIDNGANLGVSLEHTGCDAGIWVYLLNQIDDYAVNHLTDVPSSTATADVKPLAWFISPALSTALTKAENDYCAVASAITTSEKVVENISRTRIKACACRPDALVQALFQATYYKLTGRFRSTYEAVSTRAFYQGRTECVRPCTAAAADFARTFVDKTADAPTIIEKFRGAETAHMDQIKRCQNGLGPERHMAGLLAMHQMFIAGDKTLVPAIFETVGYQTLGASPVSTSSTTAPYIQYFGFGPVVTDGIGIGYGLKNDALHLSISAYQDSTIAPQVFIETLESLADEFFALF